MPRIPLTDISMAPQVQGGVNVPNAGMISDAVGKAIQGAAISEMRGAMAAAEGEMAKGRAVTGLGKSIGNLADSFKVLQEREQKLDSLETRLAFNQDLQRHYLNREEFEFANSNNPIIDGKNIFTDYAIKGIADLRKKYGDMELDAGTAGYIAGQLSEHTIKSPAEARINSIRQRGINFNNQFKTAIESNNYTGANEINQSAFDTGLINKTQFEANQMAAQQSETTFIRANGEQRIGALLLDNNIVEADKQFELLQEQGRFTPQEREYNQALYDNKKAKAVLYNKVINDSLLEPSTQYEKIQAEIERRQKDPQWKNEPSDPTGLGRLDQTQLEDLKGKVSDIVKVKAGEQFTKELQNIANGTKGESQSEYLKRLSDTSPELLGYDNGALATFLYDVKENGNGNITGYFLDKINEIDFNDNSDGGIIERGMLKNAIEQFVTNDGIRDELLKQWSNREKLLTDSSTNPQVKVMEGMVDALVDSLDIATEPPKTVTTGWWLWQKEQQGRPGKVVEVDIVDKDDNVIGKEKKFIPAADEQAEQTKKDLSNLIKAQLRENVAAGKYTNENGTFNTEAFKHDFDRIATDLMPMPATGTQAPGITTPRDDSAGIETPYTPPPTKGANIPLPQPPAPPASPVPVAEPVATLPPSPPYVGPDGPEVLVPQPMVGPAEPGAPAMMVPEPTPEPGAYNTPSLEELDKMFNPEQQTTPTMAAGNYQFKVLDKTRDQLGQPESVEGNRIAALDYNAGGGRHSIVVIPNIHSDIEKELSQLYLDALYEWFTSNGVEMEHKGYVLTTAQNGSGKEGYFHTEPAFQEHTEAMALLMEKPDEYAAILANTLGLIPGVTFIPPHEQVKAGAQGPGLLNERDFALEYIIPELVKIQGGGITTRLTAYSPQKGASNVYGAGGEGGYEAAIPGPDGQAIVRTLDDYLTEQSDYVTISGNPKFYGKEYIIPEIVYTDKQGVRHTLENVRAVVHDTGSAFTNAEEGRFELPVARDASDATMAANHASWENLRFIPVN